MAFATTACGLVPIPFACPAIGWSNALTVELDGDTSDIATLQLCTKDGCAPSDEGDASGPLGEVDVADRDGDTWVFSVGRTSPEQVVVRTLSADGEVLSETEVAVDWVRVGGDERCGGPGAATVQVEL